MRINDRVKGSICANVKDGSVTKMIKSTMKKDICGTFKHHHSFDAQQFLRT